jgi:hypothetical protein
MTKSITMLIILLSIVAAGGAIANTQQEIAHLLNFVASTTCQYERNGTIYDGIAAQKHIKQKYHYYVDKINSAEDFIKYSATKSTMSGGKYNVHCSNLPVQYSSEWLLNELKNYRASQSD